MSNNPPLPATTFAFVGRHRVHLANPLPCPHCARLLQATDAKIDQGDMWVICSGCHRDVVSFIAGEPI